jgi:hypothetical protein
MLWLNASYAVEIAILFFTGYVQPVRKMHKVMLHLAHVRYAINGRTTQFFSAYAHLARRKHLLMSQGQSQ